MISREPVDVVFTDINMPDMSGMEFIASLTNPPLVVFITAYAEYAVDSYKLSAIDYLLKPYGFADFQRAANKAMEQFKLRSTKTGLNESHTSLSEETDGSLFVKVDYRYIRIDLDKIKYIKGYGEYLQIFVADSASPVITLSTFSSIKLKLPANFLQVHRSYIINMYAIDSINKNRIVIDNDTYIPVGETYKDSLQSFLSNHSIGNTPKR